MGIEKEPGIGSKPGGKEDGKEMGTDSKPGGKEDRKGDGN